MSSRTTPGQSQKILIGYHPLVEQVCRTQVIAASSAFIGESKNLQEQPVRRIIRELVIAINPSPASVEEELHEASVKM